MSRISVISSGLFRVFAASLCLFVFFALGALIIFVAVSVTLWVGKHYGELGSYVFVGILVLTSIALILLNDRYQLSNYGLRLTLVRIAVRVAEWLFCNVPTLRPVVEQKRPEFWDHCFDLRNLSRDLLSVEWDLKVLRYYLRAKVRGAEFELPCRRSFYMDKYADNPLFTKALEAVREDLIKDKHKNYDKATQLIEEGCFTQALNLFEEIEAVDSNYRDVQELKLTAKEGIPAEREALRAEYPGLYRPAEDLKGE